MILELNQEISNFGMVNLRKSKLAMAHPPFMTMIFAIKTPNLLGNCPIARYDYYIEGIEGTVIESGGSSESLSVCNRCWIDMDLWFMIYHACANVHTEGSFPGFCCLIILFYDFFWNSNGLPFTPNDDCRSLRLEVRWKISSRTSRNFCAKILKPAGRRAEGWNNGGPRGRTILWITPNSELSLVVCRGWIYTWVQHGATIYCKCTTNMG